MRCKVVVGGVQHVEEAPSSICVTKLTELSPHRGGGEVTREGPFSSTLNSTFISNNSTKMENSSNQNKKNETATIK